MKRLLFAALLAAMPMIQCAARAQENAAPDGAEAQVGADAAVAQPTLTIGSAAPELQVEHWVQDGGGKFKPITKFEPGKVYVVEFWATWCGPCVASMPHLAALQTELADQGVQIISISDEDLATVEEFLGREVPPTGAPAEGDQPAAATQTFRELTSAYCLTTDPDESSSKDYMQAAQQNGIPTAFLVGKDGKIEWIGHPMQMDEPLRAVIGDSWDRAAFAKQLQEQEAEKLAMYQVMALLQREDFDQALQLIDARLAIKDSMQLKMLKLQTLLQAKRIDDAQQHADALFAGLAAEPSIVNMVAWNLYMMAAEGRIEKGPLIDTAVVATEQAVKDAAADERASVIDTLAHLHHLNGNLDRAIELEREAVKLAGDRERQFIEGFLKELEAAKAQESAADKTEADK